MTALDTYWNSLPKPRQIFMIALAAVLALSLLYVFIDLPLKRQYQQLQEQYQQLNQDRQWLQQQAQARHGQKQHGPTQQLEGSLIGTLNQRFQAAGLTAATKRVRPEGDKRLRIELENADFNRLIQQLAWFEQKSVHIEQLQLSASQQPGYVSGRITLSR